MRLALALCLISVLSLVPLVKAGTPPVLYFSFENIQGNSVTDDSGNGNDDELIDAKQSDGKVGKGLVVESGNQVVIPVSESLDPDFFGGNFTLVMWIDPMRAGAKEWQQLWRSRAKDDNHTTLFINHNGTLSLRGDSNQAWTVFCEAPDADPPTGEWSHIAVTSDQKKFRIYVNGKEIRTDDWQEMDGGNEAYYLGWGGVSGDEGYAGKYDEVALFADTLSLMDINLLITKGVEAYAAVMPSGKLTATWGTLKSQ